MGQDSNTKQALWVAIGSFTSFSFSIVSSMILSRYFDKNDYGTYKQVMYVYNAILFVFTLGLPQAFSYFLPRVSKEEGEDIVNKLTKVFFIGGVAFSLFLFFMSSWIAEIMKNPDLAVGLKVFSISPLLMLPTMGIDSIYSTYRKTYISTIYVILTRSFMLICVALPVIIFRLTYVGAIWGFVVSSFISFLIALYLKKKPFVGLKKRKSPVTYKEIFHFSLPLVYASFWGIILKSCDQFFISRYFGVAIFADFSNGFIELPFVGMVVSACSTVLFPVFSKLCHGNSNPATVIYPLWINVFDKTAKIVYPLIIFSIFYAKDIMVILYGGKYADAEVYFQIMQISTFFNMITFAPLVLSLGKTKYYSNVHMICAITLVVLEWISVKTIASPYFIAILSVIMQIVKILFLMGIIAKIFELPLIKLFPIKTILLIVLPSIFMLSIIKYYLDMSNCIISCFVAFCIYTLLYIIYSKLIGLNYFKILKPLLFK